MVSPFLPDAEKRAAVRQALPATAAGIYLDTATAGPLSSEVAAAVAQVAEWELRTGRVHGAVETDTTDRAAEARAAVAALLTTDIDAVALCHGTLEAVDLVLAGLPWRPGDRIVTTTSESPATIAALRSLERDGVEVVIIAAEGPDDAVVDRARDAIAGSTRLVVMSHVGWPTGRLLPVDRVAALARDRGALLLVDGDRAAGAIPVDPVALGADVYAVSGHCWLLAPEGTGAAWFGPRAIESIRPRPSGAFVPDQDIAGARRSRASRGRDASPFEPPGFDRAAIVGLGRSCGWLSMYVGLQWIHDRGRSLARHLLAALARTEGIEVLTPPDAIATIVSIRFRAWTAARALEELEHRAFVMARTVPELDAIRFSVAFFNTEEELDTLVEAVDELGRHTPETLPRRRTLTLASDGLFLDARSPAPEGGER